MDLTLRKSKAFDQKEPLFFLSEAFLFCKSPPVVIERNKDNSFIKIPFKQEGEILYSLPGSPFGGFEFSADVTPPLLTDFLNSLTELDDLKGFNQIVVRTPPQCYNPARWTIQHNAFSLAGFVPKIVDVNFHLNLSNSFRANLHRAEKRYLNIAKKENWVFERVEPQQYLTQAYRLFAEAKSKKGYPMTMKLPELARMYRDFPDNYFLFGVFREGELIAASCAISVNKDILYDFYHGDKINMRHKSPVVFLLEGIFDYAKSTGKEILDLGICSVEGQRNQGLCSFKENLGGIESPKIIYEKKR